MPGERGIPLSNEINNIDELHNINCFDYLSKIAVAIRKPPEKNLSGLLANLNSVKWILKLCSEEVNYNSKIPYGNLFSDFMLEMQQVYVNETLRSNILPLYEVIYKNDNEALTRSYAIIKDVVLHRNHIYQTEHEITNTFSGKTTNNITSPIDQGSNWGRFSAMISDDFKPQLTTNIPSVRKYDFKDSAELPMELRFGTQGERHDGNPRANPLFEGYLESRKNSGDGITKIQHIYFNNLGLTRDDYEGKKERDLSIDLHALEKRHENIAVITLPADKFLMSEKMLSNEAYGNCENLQVTILSILLNESKDPNDRNDFYISPKIRKKLFGDTNLIDQKEDSNEEIKLSIEEKVCEFNKYNQLVNYSFKAVGLDLESNQNITKAQAQAVYFHLMKYELPNFILEKLQPETFNMSCKDAIDRGGVSSAYYNIIKSFELYNKNDKKEEFLMKKDEFLEALHAAPTLVKGRGMNHHVQLIWNAVNEFIKARDIEGKGDGVPGYLREWRDKNPVVHLKKNELIRLVKQELLEKKEDINRLIHLLKDVNNAKNDKSNIFRELWHQKTGIPEKYQGEYGETKTAKEVISLIKKEIISLIESDISAIEKVENKPELKRLLTEHSSDGFRSIGKTKSEESLRSTPKLSQIFYGEEHAPSYNEIEMHDMNPT